MKEKEISIIDLAYMIFSNKILIVALAVIMGVVTYFYTTFMVSPTYVAKGTLYVTIDNNYTVQSNVDINNIMAAQELSNTYIEILSSNTFFRNVCEDLSIDYQYSSKQLKAMTSYGKKEDSEIIQVRVTAYDPKEAAEITAAILSNAQSFIPEIVVGGSAKVIDSAEEPMGPSAPNIPKNCMIAVLFGIVIGCAINFIKAYFDDSIKNIGLLAENFNIPVLAEIPVYEQSTAKSTSK